MHRGHRLERALKGLLDTLRSGGARAILSTSDAGEFTASAPIQFAYDTATKKVFQATGLPFHTFAPIFADAFLKTLLSPSATLQEVEARRGILLGAFVCSLQMIVFETVVSQEVLLEAFQRDCGGPLRARRTRQRYCHTDGAAW